MSVSVKGLTKIYGTQRAVDAVTFEAKKGEVLGFLGPNGAGKTTTMKIITCFIAQDDGQATVCGYDTRNDPMEVRRRIGYLPENNPLYREMYVKEYLDFVARLNQVPNRKKRIGEMIELTGLQREQHKQIQALSKGYRQRVGLAQAMLHDPEVLILDEPTAGLDPNQLAEIRQLIHDLGQEKTLLFSTHIMQEVQAICDRVVIINKGKIAANDAIEKLPDLISGESVVTLQFKETVQKQTLEQIKGVLNVVTLPDNRWKVATSKDTDLRPELFRFAVDQGLTLLEMFRETRSIEQVFQQLTKET